MIIHRFSRKHFAVKNNVVRSEEFFALKIALPCGGDIFHCEKVGRLRVSGFCRFEIERFPRVAPFRTKGSYRSAVSDRVCSIENFPTPGDGPISDNGKLTKHGAGAILHNEKLTKHGVGAILHNGKLTKHGAGAILHNGKLTKHGAGTILYNGKLTKHGAGAILHNGKLTKHGAGAILHNEKLTNLRVLPLFRRGKWAFPSVFGFFRGENGINRAVDGRWARVWSRFPGGGRSFVTGNWIATGRKQKTSLLLMKNSEV